MNPNQVHKKHRVFILTDIENEPDDAQSLVRFLTYANEWDVEGLVATTSIHLKDKTAAWRIREIVEAYGQVRDNLEQHAAGFPEGDHLMSLIKEGPSLYGMQAVGEEHDSSGSEWLVQAVDRYDPRSEEHTSELQSRGHLICRLLLEIKNKEYLHLRSRFCA